MVDAWILIMVITVWPVPQGMTPEQRHRVVLPSEAACVLVRDWVRRDSLFPEQSYVVRCECEARGGDL